MNALITITPQATLTAYSINALPSLNHSQERLDNNNRESEYTIIWPIAWSYNLFILYRTRSVYF